MLLLNTGPRIVNCCGLALQVEGAQLIGRRQVIDIPPYKSLYLPSIGIIAPFALVGIRLLLHFLLG